MYENSLKIVGNSKVSNLTLLDPTKTAIPDLSPNSHWEFWISLLSNKPFSFFEQSFVLNKPSKQTALPA